MNPTIYLLPGRGGRLNKGLGAELMARGYALVGRALEGEFKSISFSEQVDCVANDLRTTFWREDALVVANSFGAYFFLQAQAELPPFPGKVLLLSPIVGEATNEEHMMFFVPPRADRLRDQIMGGRYPSPTYCEIHVGKEDWQSDPAKVSKFGKAMGISVTVVPGSGHRLDQGYVGEVLDKWLPPQPSPCPKADCH